MIQTPLLLIILLLFAYILNLPFGYLRARSRKYSFMWLLYIHLPIPFIVLFRTVAHIEYWYIPLVIIASVIGQFHGGRWRVKAADSSC